MENRAQAIKNQIDEMLTKKAAELEGIRQKYEQMQKAKEEAEARKQKASEKTDLKEYQKALKDLKDAETAISMYEARYEQLKNKEFLTEEESDKVIDSLLAYESMLESNFLLSYDSMIREAARVLSDYMDAVNETEKVIKEWTSNIHANYRSKTTRRRLPEGGYTNRMEKPQPVRVTQYKGCEKALALADFMERQRKI